MPEPEATARRLQLVVLYNDNVHHYIPITAAEGWHVDAATRQIVVGRGVPRTFVPLDQVRSYSVEVVTGGRP